MLWGSLAVLAFSFMMAASGRFYPAGFGVGIGLLVLWYFSEREGRHSPATEDERSNLEKFLHESSTDFDLPNFPVFLRQIAPHLARGFGGREISKLTTLAGHLPHNRESQTEFQVVFENTPIPLRVRLFKDDVSSITVYFFTSATFAELLDREIESFFAERGL